MHEFDPLHPRHHSFARASGLRDYHFHTRRRNVFAVAAAVALLALALAIMCAVLA